MENTPATMRPGSGIQNVLLILTDEQRFDALGANGNPHIQTPHLDAFAASALNFQQHRVSCPICTPSRSSLLTGQYARTHGALQPGFTLNRRAETLAHVLRREGYATGIFGKSHLEPECSGFNAAVDSELRDYYGFATARLSEDNLCGPYVQWLTREHPQWVSTAWAQANEEIHKPPAYGTDADGRLRATFATELPPELSQSTWITRQTEAFIQAQTGASRPFFAVCSYVPPHHPWTPPRSCLERYDPATLPVPSRNPPGYGLPVPLSFYNDGSALRDEELQRLTAAYYALCTHVDDCIGQLLQTLQASGAADRTLVIFTSDHGDHLGDRGMIRKSATLFDNLIHVPLLVRVPGAAHARGACHELTQHEDLAPTVLNLLGLPVPRSFQGSSFAPILRQADDTRRPDQPPSPDRSILPLREHQFFEYPLVDQPYARVGIGDRRYKLVRHHPDPGWILIDREADPAEQINLAGSHDHAAVEQQLRTALLDWLTSTGLCYGPKPYSW